MTQASQAKVGVVMGSRSDLETMRHACETLQSLGIAHHARVLSAHRTPDEMFAYAESARGRGLEVIIAGAGGAAHLPGMLAAKTDLPVLGVPIGGTALNGQDSLYSIVQMPRGVPVATFAIGRAGAVNAALFAARMFSLHDASVRGAIEAYAEALKSAAGRETLETAA